MRDPRGTRFLPSLARKSTVLLSALVVVGLCVSFMVAVPAGAVHAFSSASAAPASGPLSAAEQSLANGGGPAGSSPMGCSVVAGDVSCSTTPAGGTATSAGWGNITARQPVSPIPRSYGRSMAYDPVDHYVVLFGGYTEDGYVGDTWKFANNTWTELSPTNAPSDRDHSTLVWDVADGYLLLFGGSGNGGQYGDTWSFLGGQWTPHTESTHPSGRWSASMTYDASDGYVLLFGGCNSGSEQDDTWTYLAGTWTELSPAQHPSDRGDAGMTYDPSAGVVVFFGGYDDASSWGYFNDTWTFHAGNWTWLNPALSPSARTSPAFAYDPWLGGVVMFGGEGPSNYLADTWLFANGNWTPISTGVAPSPRMFGIMATDPADGYLLLFGGEGNNFYNDTWAFYTVNASANESVAQGAAPLPVTFQANASSPFGVASYDWAFGDGTDGVGASVDHTYQRSGLFLATVTITDINGVASSVGLTVNVTPALSLLAVVSATEGAAPLVVQFSAIASGGTGPYDWSWTVAGNLVAGTENASYTFTIPAVYVVSATVVDSTDAHAGQSFQVNVTAAAPVPLNVTISTPVLAGEAPFDATFQSTVTGGIAPYVLSWDFGDGSGGSGASPSHWYNFSGNYSVTLQVSDAAHTVSTARLALAVVTPVSVVASSSVSGGRAPLSVTFTANATGGVGPIYFLWNFGDGGTGSGAVVAHEFTKAGTFAVTVEVVDSSGHVGIGTTSLTITSGTAMPPTTNSSGSTTASLDPTTVFIGAEFGAVAIVVALLVLLFRRRR